MGKVTRLNPSKPRKMRETVFTGGGLRLEERASLPSSKWFLPLVVGLSSGAFLQVLFW